MNEKVTMGGFFREIHEDFDLNAFKILMFALSNAKLPEKYRCMFAC